MIPATMTGWMRWYAELASRPGSGDSAITRAPSSALRSK